VPGTLQDLPKLTLDLRNPDYNTAVRIVDAINGYAVEHYGMRVAREQDQKSVALEKPPHISTARFIAEIGDLTVQADSPARVVMDSRNGTVVIGQDVQISTIAVTHGNLTVRITETPVVSQPAPFSQGKTIVVPRTDIEASQQGGPVAILRGTSLRSLVAGLNQIGLKPSAIIAILQAIKTAGALQADLVVQ
jgi:flagellar P-ring protein precursor FlgI